MKYLSTLLISLVLVACGGGDETPIAIIKTSTPHPVANAATVSGGSAVAVHMYQALYGMAPSNATLIAHTVQATADPSTFARSLASNFASTSSTALAKLVLDNLGVTATTVTAVNAQGQSEYAILLDALGQMFTYYGADARGQIILNATNLLAGLETDVTYGVTATSYNNQATANYSYSSNTSNTGAAAVSTATANAGAAQNVAVGTLVTLDGSASKADVGRTLTYAWTLSSKPAGSSAALSSLTTTKPTFTADVAGIYVASLVVNDGNASSSTRTATVTATQNAVPIAIASAEALVMRTGTSVRLEGNQSYDTDHDPITHNWAIKSKPVGSNATISNTNIVNPLFTADLDGRYTVNLIVHDGKVSSSAYELNITSTNNILEMVSVVAKHGSGTINNNYFLSGTKFSMEIRNISNETFIFSDNIFNILGGEGMRTDYFANTASLSNNSSFAPGNTITVTSTIQQSMKASNDVWVFAFFVDPKSNIKSGIYSAHHPYNSITANFPPFSIFNY